MKSNLLTFTDSGIYCPKGDFYIDPWRKVDKAIITHAHADHARWGMNHYLAHIDSVPVMRLRLGSTISVQSVNYGEVVNINGVEVSLHPAGHIIGSAQVKVSYKGETWVVSGDYKPDADLTCKAFEPIKCNVFISESTFGLPIYKWQHEQVIFNEINNWWWKNRTENKVSIIYGYSLGKAQRILQGVDSSIGSVFVHGAVYNVNMVLQNAGIGLNPFRKALSNNSTSYKGALIIAPPSAGGSAWFKRFGKETEEAFASGWMNLRGARRRRNIAKGFVLSDHADFDGIVNSVKATQCEKVYFTHGYSSIMAQYFNENGISADVVKTAFEGDAAEENIKNEEE